LVAQAQSLAVGGSHACALRSDRTVLCWGSGASGQLGRGAPVSASGPMAMIVGSAAVTDAEAIHLGPEVTCIRRARGEMWCTGRGLPGETAAVQTLRPVPSLDRARAVSLWGTRGCALGEDDVLRCWGNTPGALGVTQSAMPMAVTF
jgi:alpha-tubulin suppressor-like RCC1 family protein